MENVERQRKVVQLKTDPSFASKIQTTGQDERLVTEVFSKLNSNSATDLNTVEVRNAAMNINDRLTSEELPIISEAPTGSHSIDTQPQRDT